MKSGVVLALLITLTDTALAHHLDDYDARIRAEARLPAEWFTCKSSEDCALASVPCQSGLAVNTSYKEQAREALIDAFPICLGTSLNDTEATCEKRQCATRPIKEK